ncbi:chorion peroxidase-like [Penaeus indicus]|uniref:chorion peroxidase-like n=1 Tax=Penaeus indicus TaxID=29960 RepID=UPI00300DBAF6
MHMTSGFFVAVALVTLTPIAEAKPGKDKPVNDLELEEIRLSADNQFAEIVLENYGIPVNWELLCNTEQENSSLCNDFLHYRSSDGTCNNLHKSTWGAAYKPYRRLAGYEYGDGISIPRKASDASELPNAHLVSRTVDRLPSSPSSSSYLHKLFGLFVTLDLAATPLVAAAEDETISCCQKSRDDVTANVNSKCASVSISAKDTFFSEFDQQCMEVVRSAPAQKCESGPRDQMNVATAYLDASTVYGSDQHTINSRRTFNKGHLHVTVTDESVDSQYLISQNIEALVKVIYHMVTRYHNNIADRLKETNVDWDDETLFQESRRIVVAQLQQVVYNEYLPKLLGPQAMTEYQLTPLTGTQRREDYSASKTIATSSEFETASLHLSQSQSPYLIELEGKEIDIEKFLEFASVDVLRGLSRNDAGRLAFTKEITASHEPLGIDLLALNIQRGREHGLAGYMAVQAACKINDINTFADLTNIMDQKVIDRLKSVYNDVRDIDLLIGGAFERPVPDGELGPTLTCVLAEQFSRIRQADRYWYETHVDDTKFDDDQLKALHSTTLAAIMCDAFPELQVVQRRPLEVVSAENPLVFCRSVPNDENKLLFVELT